MTASASTQELLASSEATPLLVVDVLPQSHLSVRAKASSELDIDVVLPPATASLAGLGYVALSAVCFSLVSTGVKIATQTISSMEFIFWRSIVALALNYMGVLYWRKSLAVDASARGALCLQCCFGFASVALGFFAFSRMVLADASVIIFTSPVLTFALGACVLKEKVDTTSAMCALTACLGLVFVLKPTFLFGYSSMMEAPTHSWLPTACAVAAAVSQALLYTSVRRLQHVHSLAVVHYFLSFSIAAAGFWLALVEQHLTLDAPAWLWATLLLSGACTFLGQVALTKGFQLEKAGIASVMRYLDVVCVFLWDVLLLHESVSALTILGALIICSCAGIIALRRASE